MEKKLIYENPLSSEADIKDFILEGQAKLSFDNGCLRMENALSAEEGQKANHTCNLRKSYGFYLVTQGADPIPDVSDCHDFFKLSVVKFKGTVSFSVNGLKVFEFKDDNPEYGAPLEGGKIGFRQLAPMVGEYRGLKVFELSE